MKRAAALAAILALAGCDALPRDTAGTNDRVASERRFRAGLIAATPANDLLDRIEARTGAAGFVIRGSGEPLLLALERGDLDIVVGEFAHDTPWATRVHIMPPPDKARVSAAARNGENRWIAEIHEAVTAP